MNSRKNIKILTLIIILTLFNACAKKEQSIQTEKKENTMNIANTSEEARRNASKNPFGLVYEGAITENEKGKVNIIPVSYNIRENKIVANIYIPANFDSNQKYPAIVVAHPNGGVKEQVSGLYAQRLAELGYIHDSF
ncbi:alpha/beta hydrolase [Brachyspira sp.]|uniref:alpha/beta hydrolase n=1 Tax=Brachyspira sp. TaxID=1977261 RepID=UPI003D7E7F53